jgi:hypothetical protein
LKTEGYEGQAVRDGCGSTEQGPEAAGEKTAMSLMQVKAPPTKNAQKFNPRSRGKAFSET